jgi:hypothetical protein
MVDAVQDTRLDAVQADDDEKGVDIVDTPGGAQPSPHAGGRPAIFDEHLLEAIAQLRVWGRKVDGRPMRFERAYRLAIAMQHLVHPPDGDPGDERQYLLQRLREKYRGRKRKDLETEAQLRLDSGGRWAVVQRDREAQHHDFKRLLRELETAGRREKNVPAQEF